MTTEAAGEAISDPAVATGQPAHQLGLTLRHRCLEVVQGAHAQFRTSQSAARSASRSSAVLKALRAMIARGL